MLVTVASAARPGQVNEDFVVAGPDIVVLLDGAGLPSGLETGCSHGVPWFVQTLGARIFQHAVGMRASLAESLADAIDATAGLHRATCDLGNPMTPSATVAVTRVRGEAVEWLVLADSTIVFRTDAGLDVISDSRLATVTDRNRTALTDRLRHLEPDQRLRAMVSAQREAMNAVEGYWVASALPEAAQQSLTGHVPAAAVKSVAVLSDGAARAVDDFRVMNWGSLIGQLEREGPQSIIRRTRELEQSDPQGQRWPRGKIHDDATVALLQSLPES